MTLSDIHSSSATSSSSSAAAAEAAAAALHKNEAKRTKREIQVRSTDSGSERKIRKNLFSMVVVAVRDHRDLRIDTLMFRAMSIAYTAVVIFHI